MTDVAKDLVLWDGDCGFCRRSIEWVQRQDGAGHFAAVPYQQAPAPPMTPALEVACERAVHVIRADGQMLRAGRAVIYILSVLEGGLLGRAIGAMRLPPFIWLIELGYYVVARNRRFFSRFLFRRRQG